MSRHFTVLRQNHWLRYLPAIAFSLLPALIGGCSSSSQERQPSLSTKSVLQSKTAPLPFKAPLTEEVSTREIALPLHLQGIIEVDFNKEVAVTSHLTGRVQQILVKLGDNVSVDQTLAVLESQEVSEIEAELIEAQSKLETAIAHEKRERIIYREQVERPKSLIDAQTAFKDAGARRDLAESEYKRTDSLFKEKIVAGKDFHVASAELSHAQAHYEQALATLQREQHLYQNRALMLTDLQLAKGDVKKAEQHLDTLKQRLEFLGMTKSGVRKTIATGKLSGELNISAPLSGVIIKQEIATGEVVQPDKPMFTVTDLSTVLVRADLPETHILRAKLGTKANIRVSSYPDKHFSGKISFISERVNADTHMVAMRVRLANPEHYLKKNMSAEIDLEPELTKVTLCPKSALFESKGPLGRQTHVFVKNSRGSFDERTVAIGAESDGMVEVLGCLKCCCL